VSPVRADLHIRAVRIAEKCAAGNKRDGRLPTSIWHLRAEKVILTETHLLAGDVLNTADREREYSGRRPFYEISPRDWVHSFASNETALLWNLTVEGAAYIQVKEIVHIFLAGIFVDAVPGGDVHATQQGVP
jgi:hypothetical protein